MSQSRIQINGVYLRCGRTFVARVTARRIVGAAAQTRYTSLKCVYVRTKSAVTAASNLNFVQEERGKRRLPAVYDDALQQFEAKRSQPNFTRGDAAVAVAHLVMVRRDIVETNEQRQDADFTLAWISPWCGTIGSLDATQELNTTHHL
jgi:hypothetical protein